MSLASSSNTESEMANFDAFISHLESSITTLYPLLSQEQKGFLDVDVKQMISDVRLERCKDLLNKEGIFGEKLEKEKYLSILNGTDVLIMNMLTENVPEEEVLAPCPILPLLKSINEGKEKFIAAMGAHLIKNKPEILENPTLLFSTPAETSKS